MPNCSVRICKNRNENVSYKKDGITFHRFPKDIKYKEKWIEATRMPENWFPTTKSTICSQHFEETCFRPSDKRRLLLGDAVPTLKLQARLVYETTTENAVLTPAMEEDAPPRKKHALNSDTQRKKILHTEIAKRDRLLRLKQLKIKRLQSLNRRLKKKNASLTEMLNKLKTKSLITSDQ